MPYRFLADLALVAHLAFVVFVAFGGLLLYRFPRVAWVHAPVALYGAAIEFIGWVCPLTPLEVRWRRLAGEAGYSGGFIDHYIGGVLYPADWTAVHIWLGAFVLALNAAIYWDVFVRRRRKRLRAAAAAHRSRGEAAGSPPG